MHMIEVLDNGLILKTEVIGCMDHYRANLMHKNKCGIINTFRDRIYQTTDVYTEIVCAISYPNVPHDSAIDLWKSVKKQDRSP